MKSNLFILFNLILLSVFSQKTLILEGKILDKQNEAIPFATISLQESLVATTSDLEGNFNLIFSSNNLPDSLVIRHISFTSKKLFLSENNFKNSINIKLETKENEVGVIEITAKTALNYIEKAISKIEENYISNTYYLEGFYRQIHKENGKFVRLIEAMANIKETIFERGNEKQKERFAIHNIRRSNVYERNGDKHGDHFVDLMSENPINYTQVSFLNLNNIHNYNFKKVANEKSTEEKIFFQNKVWQAPQNKSGFIVINKEDFAVLSIEIVSTKNPSYRAEQLSNWKFQNGTYSASFRKDKGKYFCSKSSKYYNHYVLNEYSNNIDFVVEEYFEWFTFDLFKEKTSNKKYSLLSNLYSLDYKYNADYWREMILPKTDPKVFSDLNTFKDLERQFLGD